MSEDEQVHHQSQLECPGCTVQYFLLIIILFQLQHRRMEKKENVCTAATSSRCNFHAFFNLRISDRYGCSVHFQIMENIHYIDKHTATF